MESDKQIFQIFSAQPEWIYLLKGEPSPGPCRFKSITVKAIEHRSDGLLEPFDARIQLTVVEVQGYQDIHVYNRIVIEMAQIQQVYPGRGVEGIIIFLDENLDPETEPWKQIVRSISLKDAIKRLQQKEPEHPMVAVFRHLLAESDAKLEIEAATCYNWIQKSDLSPDAIRSLSDVFVNWLGKRFSQKDKKEIEEMLLGQLPDIRDTQLGKNLIAIGISEGKLEGKIEGKIEALLKLLELRFKTVPDEIAAEIQKIVSLEKVDRLYEKAVQAATIDEFRR